MIRIALTIWYRTRWSAPASNGICGSRGPNLLGAKLRVPVLQEQGFDLIGGRLLPGDSGARAQFMYQNTGGERVTLYLSAVPKNAAAVPTAFRFESAGPVSAFYWIDRDLSYALSGDLPRARLLKLSELIYSQLGS